MENGEEIFEAKIDMLQNKYNTEWGFDELMICFMKSLLYKLLEMAKENEEFKDLLPPLSKLNHMMKEILTTALLDDQIQNQNIIDMLLTMMAYKFPCPITLFMWSVKEKKLNKKEYVSRQGYPKKSPFKRKYILYYNGWIPCYSVDNLVSLASHFNQLQQQLESKPKFLPGGQSAFYIVSPRQSQTQENDLQNENESMLH